jgi:hypothetical protein
MTMKQSHTLITGFVKSRITPPEPPWRNRFYLLQESQQSPEGSFQFLGVNLVADERALVDDQMFS